MHVLLELIFFTSELTPPIVCWSLLALVRVGMRLVVLVGVAWRLLAFATWLVTWLAG